MDLESGAQVSFGIGCFAFEVADARREEVWEFDEWRSAVQTALSALPNVADVVVDLEVSMLLGPEWTPFRDDSESSPPSLKEFEPDIPGTFVEFDITIPRRMHADLIEHELASERFTVTTMYEFHGPVTFVRGVDHLEHGSQAVRLLWRFLERELPKQSTDIKFTNLGPSPFHVDAKLSPADGGDVQESPFECSRTRLAGYDMLDFKYSTDEFSDIHDATYDLYDRLSGELSLFYKLVRLRNLALHSDLYLAEGTAALVAGHQKRGLRATVRRIFGASGPARQLGLAGLSAKIQNASSAALATREINEVLSPSDRLRCFEGELREYAPSLESLVVRNTLEVVDFVETGRSKEFEIAIVGASTLLGGLAGAIAAVVAK